MAPAVSSPASVLAAGLPASDGSYNKRTVLLCTGAATLLTLVVWLSRPRRSRATKEEALDALRLLRLEFTAAYADVSTVVARHGSAAPVTANADAPDDRLRQALEQPLVLDAALREATARAAAGRGCSPEALEQDVRLHEVEEEVQEGMQEIKEMHAACLAGCTGEQAPGAKALAGMWKQDEALNMLRELGRAKAERLRSICASPLEVEGSCPPAAALVAACAEAEQEVWRCHPDAGERRSLLGPAIEAFAAKSTEFARRRAALEAELEAATCT